MCKALFLLEQCTIKGADGSYVPGDGTERGTCTEEHSLCFATGCKRSM